MEVTQALKLDVDQRCGISLLVGGGFVKMMSDIKGDVSDIRGDVGKLREVTDLKFSKLQATTDVKFSKLQTTTDEKFSKLRAGHKATNTPT